MQERDLETIDFSLAKRCLLRLIDIKNNNDCWFQYLNSYSVFYKTPLQIINHQFIIDLLMPLDASMVGIVCGEYYENYLKKGEILCESFNLNFTHTESKYKLLFISRDGCIEYETDALEKCRAENALQLIKKKEIIKKFSSFDAYYIGFLAGLELFKMNNIKSKSKKPILRLVKF